MNTEAWWRRPGHVVLHFFHGRRKGFDGGMPPGIEGHGPLPMRPITRKRPGLRNWPAYR